VQAHANAAARAAQAGAANGVEEEEEEEEEDANERIQTESEFSGDDGENAGSETADAPGNLFDFPDYPTEEEKSQPTMQAHAYSLLNAITGARTHPLADTLLFGHPQIRAHAPVQC
jgi:hypothetical protein